MPQLSQFRPTADALRALTRLALPIVIVQVGIMLMGVVDTIMVGHISATALAAVAVGNMYFYSTAVFGMGVLMALDPLVSQAAGAHDEPAIARAVQRGFAIALVLTVLIAGLMLLAGPVLHALRQPAEVVPTATQFAHIMIPGALPLLLFVVLRQSLQSLGVVKPIVISIVVSNIVNLVLNWILIYGRFGFPEMGVAGSAWATTISRFVLFLSLVWFAYDRIRPYVKPLHPDSFALAPVLRMVRLGAPIGFHHILEYGAFMAVMVIMGTLGTTELASHQVAINLASLTFMVPLGVAQAGGVLVGNAVGRGDSADARQAAGAALLVGTGFMFLMALAFLALPGQLAAVYTSDPAVLALSVLLIRLAGVFQVFDGLQVVSAGLLRGVGDTRVPMISGLVGFWLIGMPVSLWLGLRAGMGAVGLWWGLVVGLAVVSVFLVMRVFMRLGRRVARIFIDATPAVTTNR